MQRNFFLVMMILTAIVVVATAFVRPEVPGPASEQDIRRSLGKSIVLLQQAGYTFSNRNKFHCAGCHHQCLSALLEEKALQKGLPIIDSLRTINIKTVAITMAAGANSNLPDDMAPSKFATSYGLISMAAAKYPADQYTDISVDFILNNQLPDGSFLSDHSRVPAEAGDAHLAALSVRAIQYYGSPAKKARINNAIANARQWFEKLQTGEMEQEKSFHLLGLSWTGGSAQIMKQVTRELVSLQNPDGGWAQLPTMTSDAYSTGETLYALKESGMLSTTDPIYQRGIRYLLDSQQPEGNWVVISRAVPVQAFFNAGFPPHDENQFISAAATNWASLALVEALPDK